MQSGMQHCRQNRSEEDAYVVQGRIEEPSLQLPKGLTTLELFSIIIPPSQFESVAEKFIGRVFCTALS